MNVPDDLFYTPEHEWVKVIAENRARIGISDYAQDQLGDVVYIELPEVGKIFVTDDLMAEIESTKSVGEVYAPFGGTVVAVNQIVSDAPETVNTSPYDEGWLLELEVEGTLSTGGLLDAAAYRDLTE